MNEYDQAARYAGQRLFPQGFFRWLLGERAWSAWRWRDWLDSQSVPFPGEPDRRVDTVVAFDRHAADEPPMAVVVEFLSRARAEVLERLTEYTLRIRREIPAHRDPLVRFAVVGILINLTGRLESGSWQMRPADMDGLGLSSDARPINLCDVPAGDVLTGVAGGTVAAALLPWVPLMLRGDDPATVAEWMRLAALEPNESKRGDYGGLARVFAGLAGRAWLWTPALEGWNVEISPFLEEQRLRGEARGRLKAAREYLLLVLGARLGQDAPPDVVQLIQQQQERDLLERWLQQAATVKDLDEVRRMLGLPTN